MHESLCSLFMDRKDLIGFVLKDIKELELIVRGMHEMDTIPGVVQDLVISKTESILAHFHSLKGGSFKKEKEAVQEVKIPEVTPPVVKVPEVKTPVIKEPEVKTPEVKEPIKREATMNEKFKSQTPSLHAAVATGKRAESRFIHSLRKAINLNDRYRYQRELFRGDIELMNQVIEKLDAMKTFSEAMDYVQREFSWDPQSETVADFYSLLENRFS